MITINKNDFKRIASKKVFAKRPYCFIFIKRSDYPFLADMEYAFEEIGVKGHAINIFPWTKKQDFITDLLEIILQTNPDFILTLSHNGVDPEGDLINLLEDLNIPLVSWLLDSPDIILSPFEKVVRENVFLFSTDGSVLQDVSQLGYKDVYYLPLGVSTRQRRNDPGISLAAKQAVDDALLFVGETFSSKIGHCIKSAKSISRFLPVYKKAARALVANRTKTVLELLSAFDGDNWSEHYLAESPVVRRNIDLIVNLYANKMYRAQILTGAIKERHLLVGPRNWKNTLKTSGINLIDSNYDRTFIQSLYEFAKITLNITSVHMHGAANERVFDVPYAGGFLLTDYSEQIAGLFDVGKEIATYSCPEDFVEQYRRYSKDAVARRTCTEKARTRIASEHTCLHRAATMISILKASQA